jgi:hypothetical protein
MMDHDTKSATVLTVLVVAAAWFVVLKPRGEAERWFVPGAMGHEAGIWRRGTEDRGRETGESSFLTRVFSGGSNAEARAWERRNGRTGQLPFLHNLSRVFPPALYDRHPEFFPWVGGQRLKPQMNPVNWNPDLGREDVAAHAAEVARDYFAANPQAVSFALGVNDGLIFGESKELRALVRTTEGQKAGGAESRDAGVQTLGPSGLPAFGPPGPQGRWFRGRPDYSNLVFTFMNRAAADLARTHPGKYLGALAYYWAENAPDFPVDPHVLPFLTADRSQGYDPAFKTEEFELQEKWALRLRAGQETGVRGQVVDNLQPHASGPTPLAPQPRLGLYDYLDGPGFLIPRIHTRLIAGNIRHAWRVGFTDYYGEGEPNWGLDGPMHWLVAQLLLDPEQPEDRLLDEYYRRYFKEAAAPMRRFFERCEEQWMHQAGPSYWLKHYRDESQAAVFPSAVCRELRGLLDEAAAIVAPESQRTGRTEDQKAGGRHSDPLAFSPSGFQTFRSSDLPTVAARVQLVSDAFGATERLVALQEARDGLNRLALEPAARTGAIIAVLGEYLQARNEFLDYLKALTPRQPMALAPFVLLDYTNHDPVVNALVALARKTGGSESQKDGKPEGQKAGGPESRNAGAQTLGPSGLPAFQPLSALAAMLPRNWEQLVSGNFSEWREICRNGGMQGTLVPARTIAGLEYGVAVPAEWVSKVEPAQFHRAVFDGDGQKAGTADDQKAGSPEGQKAGEPESLRAGSPDFRSSGLPSVRPSGSRVLRISGTNDTMVFQWNAAEAGAFYLSQVTMSGKVGPGCAATLTFGWLDAQQHNLGYTTMRLPEGDWPDPQVLSQGGFAPAGAALVGVGVRIQHQTGDDWVEVSDFTLKVAVKP